MMQNLDYLAAQLRLERDRATRHATRRDSTVIAQERSWHDRRARHAQRRINQLSAEIVALVAGRP